MGRTLNQNNSNKGGNNSVIGTNPVIRKLSKVAEQSDNCASYGGIAVTHCTFSSCREWDMYCISIFRLMFSTQANHLTLNLTTMFQPYI